MRIFLNELFIIVINRNNNNKLETTINIFYTFLLINIKY